MGAGDVQQLGAGVYLINGKKYKLTEEDLKKLNGEITQNELQALLNGKEVTAADYVATGNVGSRGYKKTEENSASFFIQHATEVLVDDDGNAIKDAQEARYNAIKAKFKEDDAKLTLDQRLNEAVETAFGPQLDQRIKDVKARDNNANKAAFAAMCFTDDEKATAELKASKMNDIMADLMGVPDENGNIHNLTEDDKQKLEQLKREFDRRFPGEMGENESFDLRGVSAAVAKKRMEQARALNKMLAIEDIIAERQQADGDKMPTGELTPAQQRELARAEIKEQITHEDQIEKIKYRLANDKSLTTDQKTKLQEDIIKLEKDRDKKIETIDESRAHEYAQAQLEYDTYRQNYNITEVHWDKKSAEAAEKANPSANNTHLTKDIQNVIKRQPEKFGCHKAGAGETPTFTDENGQGWVFDSKDYKNAMMDLANTQNTNTDMEHDADYYADTQDFVKLAESNQDAEAMAKARKKGWSDKKTAKEQGKLASLNDRKVARQMFQLAGIQVADDKTKKMRAKEFGKAALVGAGAGALAALGGELYKCASSVGFSGTAQAIASGVINTTVSGVAHVTVEGTVSGTTTVTGDVTGPVSGTVYGEVSGPISGEITGTVSGTGYNTTISTTYEYDRLNGVWVETGSQTTTTPVELTGTGNGIGYGTGYGQGTGTGTGIGQGVGTGTVDWTDQYKVTKDVPYEQDVSVEYNEEVEAPYEGTAKPKFEPINILKGAAIGAGMGVLQKAAHYIFGKKSAKDYVNENTVYDKFRSRVGYEEMAEPDEVAELEIGTVSPPQVCEAEIKDESTSTTVETQTQHYKLQKGETLYNVVKAKYNITSHSDVMAAIREIRRKMGIPESGRKDGQTVIPHIEVDGKTLSDAYWLPDKVLDKYSLKIDKDVDKVEYQPGSGGIRMNGKNTASITTTTNGRYVVKDKCGDVLYDGPDLKEAKIICDNHNAEQAKLREQWNRDHPLDKI